MAIALQNGLPEPGRIQSLLSITACNEPSFLGLSGFGFQTPQPCHIVILDTLEIFTSFILLL